MIVRLVLLLYCCFSISEGQKKKHKNIDYSDCGRRYTSDGEETLGASASKAGKFPWHVGVYKYDKIVDDYENVCGGTIISPHIVLTAAACVFDKRNKTAFRPSFFKVAAGKTAFAWSTADPNGQEINVNDITIPETYIGDINSYAENVAVLNLAKDLFFNDLVHPVCFDFSNEVYDVQDRTVQTAGWGLKGDVRYSPTLKEARLKYITIKECRVKYSSIRYLRFINYDKMCVLTPEGRREHDTGGGLVYRKGDRYHLIGIMSAYINNEFTPSTNLSRHVVWLKNAVDSFEQKKRCLDGFRCDDDSCIEDVLVCDGTPHCADGSDEAAESCPAKDENLSKTGCLLPVQRGGVSYTKLYCSDNCELKGGSYIASDVQVQINCGKGFASKDPTKRGSTYVCTKGSWFQEDPECIQLCNGLKKTNVNFNCTYNNEMVPCDQFLRPGAVASYKCSQHYRPIDPAAFSGHTTCGNGGKWIDPIPRCTADCGIENPSNLAELTISFANKTVYGKYPWHMAIFRLLSYNNSYINICGGTLISTHYVLTAAHCMFRGDGQRLTEAELMVAGGKYKRSWSVHETNQQTSRVKNILIPEDYAGPGTHYELDITLLNTETLFTFNDFVLPACLDYSGDVRVAADSVGHIVGWGLTETGDYSEDLREVHLPVISTVKCRQENKDFIPFITSDKFCVVYRNGSGTQSGDSGGGMTLINNNRHYVLGIVSIKKKGENKFSAFTKVGNHLDWMRRTMKAYNRQQ